MTATLIATKIVKHFDTPNGPLPILSGIDLNLAGGESAAIVGPSGSGKSTLLHILGGLDAPTSGDVVVNGVHPWKLSERELARFRNRTVGFVFQDHHLLPQCTMFENVLIPALAETGVDAHLERRAKDLLDRVGLSHRLNHRPSELSGGERQRAAVARAMINRPALLLCDEPTGNLDRTSAQATADVLIELTRDPESVLIMVTHSNELADRLGKKFELRDGRLV
jgi:lipoprotein-releasing system ATP-binding protein